MGKVLIKCIQTPMQKYFYDRSLDSVVMVNDEEYQILKTVEKTKLVPDGVLRRFVKSGLLRETAIEEIEHPETENLHLLAEHYMGNLILQVTQQCNLRCKYKAESADCGRRQEQIKAQNQQNYEKYHEGQMSREEFLSEKKQLEEERKRLERRKKELEELINGEKEILTKKNIPVEQMMEYLGYEKLTEEMLEKYVKGIYVYDDGRVEVEWKALA